MTDPLTLPGFPHAIRQVTDLRDALGILALHIANAEEHYNALSEPYREALKLCSEIEKDARAKNMAEVLAKAQRALEIFPALFEALRACADSYFVTEDFDSALNAYRDLLREHPNAPNIHYQMGRCYFELGDIETSAREFEMEMHLSGEAPDIYLQLGGLMMSRGRSTYLDLYQNQGIRDSTKLYQACGDYYEKAVKYFQRGLQINHGNRELQELLHSVESILNKLR